MGVNRDDGSLLQSIESILRQTHNDLEFIIVNDGSSEDVKGLVSEILDDRIVLINCVKIGLTAALNIALKKSKGKYILLLNVSLLIVFITAILDCDFVEILIFSPALI